MCPFVEKKKKKKASCLVQHMSTKKPPTQFFQPRPTSPIIPTPSPIINNYYNVQPPRPPSPSTPYYSNASYYSGLESSKVS